MLRLYRYDPLDRLTDVAGHQRFYNQARLATEIQGTVPRSVFQVGDHLLAEGGVDGSNLLATDLQRSVLHAVNPDKTQPIVYNAYGHRPPESGVASVLGFNGERADPVTGHYLLGNGYRAFNPVLMRFNSPDSWSPFGRGGINAYGYCAGDPVNRYDASGHISLFTGFKVLKSKLVNTVLFRRKKQFVSNVKSVGEELLQYEHTSSSGHRVLTFNGHGEVDSGKSFMWKGDNGIDADQLVQLSKAQGTKFEDYNLIRLLSCELAEGDFPQNVANLTGLPTKAYEGLVYISYEGRSAKQLVKLSQRNNKAPIYIPQNNKMTRLFAHVNAKSIRFEPQKRPT